MNKKIILIYLKMAMLVVISTLVIGAIISYVLLFAGSNIDQNAPENLATSARGYVKIDGDEITVDENYIKALEDGNVWLQVLDENGSSMFECNVPDDVPRKFNIFELVSYCMKSDELHGYTVFYIPTSDQNSYGIITGCDSNDVKKISYINDRTVENDWLSIAIIFIITSTVIVFISSIMFSRKISRPVTEIIDNINEITQGEYEEKEHKNNNIFMEVFSNIKKLNETLKMNEKMRAEWIANISHDLKTPLTTIQGYAEMLQNPEYESSKEEVIQYAYEIEKAERNMYYLVEDLKMSQKLKEGKIVFNLKYYDICKIITNCLESIDKSILGASKIIYKVDDEIEVFCDRDLMQRCLQNIICNAFVHNKNEITLKIEVKEEDSDIIILIEDNGKGMKESDVKHIFERYYRGTHSQNIEGTGLGLAIANEIVMLHNGKINVVSRVNEGTKFVIVLKRDADCQ